jgi:hypothetical protein
MNSRHIMPRRVPTGPTPASHSHVRTVVAETPEAEAFQLTNDALVAPSRVLASEAEHQRANVPPNRSATPSTLYVQLLAISRRCQRSNVAGVIRNACQRARGSTRFAAVRKTRSMGVIAGRRV